MIIGVDASKLLCNQATGVEVVTADLLAAILRQDQENTYWLYSPQPLEQTWTQGDRVKNIVVPGRIGWTQWHLSRALRQRPPDIFWSPSHILPPKVPAKTVASIHDLAFHLYPQSYAWKERWLSSWAVMRAVRGASQLVAVSQQTKKDLKRYFNVSGERIEVVYHALRSDFIPQEVDFSVCYLGLDKYFLYVGRIELRKNLLNVVRAFGQFATNHPEVKLVLAGRAGYGAGKIKRLINRLKLNNKIILLDYVPIGHLPMLYSRSLGVVFVSKYEGFGLPILEGWASGVPVMTSNLGAMAEIAGKAAWLVNPDDVDEIAAGMTQLLINVDLRQKLIDKGKARIQEFSWERSAQKMIELWGKI
ncbi:MAG: glycosyltransferase family 1 protein [Patescibacteria group bacterium]